MKYKLVIFDLDGTLMDTSLGIIGAVVETINEYRLPKLTNAQISSFIGPPIQWSFESHYQLPKEKAQAMADTFRKLYSNKYLLDAIPYSGIYDLMNQISQYGIHSAIATYKREDYALKLLKYYKFDHYTNIIYGGDNDGMLKKSDIILKCIESAGIKNRDEVVMIGDTIHDLNGAKELGLDFIGVSYGFGFRNEDLVGINMANKTTDIINYLK